MKIKRSFTLLEMMVVLAILSVIGALTTIHIKKLLDAHRFESEVSDLFVAIQEAQVLSCAFQTDLRLSFFQKKGILYYRISTDEPFSAKQLNQGDIPLGRTALLKFKDIEIKKLHLDIFSGGRIEPGGILTFRQSREEDAKELWFDLQHGHLLKFTHCRPSLAKQLIPAKPKEAKICN
jgi:prepilin-type N-terminal cleavage/methylation domain-containing protein